MVLWNFRGSICLSPSCWRDEGLGYHYVEYAKLEFDDCGFNLWDLSLGGQKQCHVESTSSMQ